MSFGRAFFSSCLGAFVALIAFCVLGVSFFVGFASILSNKDKVVVKDNSVLHLQLDAQFEELQEDNPFAGLPVVGSSVPKIGLLQLKQSIAHAKDDKKIKGIYVEVGHPMTGFATLEEIRESLIDFRSAGKWVVAYNEVMSEPAYYLASASDQVFLHPEGELEFNGLTAEVAFFKRMFNKLEINPQVFRVGEFKSAVEPFLYDQMSKENELQLQELLTSINNDMLEKISAQRKVSIDRLKDLSGKMLVRNAAVAMQNNLVDSLYYQDQFLSALRRKLSLKANEKINFISYNKYQESYSTYKSSKNEIAVIVAEGAIMPGKNGGSEKIIGADSFVEEIRKARTDKDIKAIVLRINSPGGEFRSSDMIWREVVLARKEKPVIASMSDYAASGGYYIAMGCDTIVAQQNTITGSIGIFGVMFDLSNFLGNKLGITFDEVKTGQYGEMFTVTRPLTEAEKNFWQRNLEDHYETFTNKAAQGRNVEQSEILKVASGRVWSGTQAQTRELIDVLGGFNDAVRIAAAKAGIADDYKIRFYPKEKPFFEKLLSDLEGNTKADIMESEAHDLAIWLDQMKKMRTYQGAQARMPFELNIH